MIFLFTGILTAVGLVAIVAKFSPSLLKKMLGYDWLIDALVTIGIPIFMGGTYSGIMTAVITGLCVSFILFVAKNTYGYSKVETVEDQGFMSAHWVEKSGKWTPYYVAKHIGNVIHVGFGNTKDELTRGWRASNDEHLATM